MATRERKQRLREDITRLLRELEFAMQDVRAHRIPWRLGVDTAGEYVSLNVSEDTELVATIAAGRPAASPAVKE